MRSNLKCVELKDQMSWQELVGVWGEAEHLLPTKASDLSTYVRKFCGRTLLVTTGRRKVEDIHGDRYEEVILKLEACETQ